MAGEPSSAPDEIFSCRELCFELMHHGERRRIVENITLDVGRGEFLTIVGASGTGKTTLLRLLGGLSAASRRSDPVPRPAGRQAT